MVVGRGSGHKTQRTLIVLTLANLALLVFTMAQMRPLVAQDVPAVLRGRALEIVDDQGRVRASLSVLPPKKEPNGETYTEVVLLRLITEQARPSVKISSSEQAAGLSFAGPTGTRDTHVILEAKSTASSLKSETRTGENGFLGGSHWWRCFPRTNPNTLVLLTGNLEDSMTKPQLQELAALERRHA